MKLKELPRAFAHSLVVAFMIAAPGSATAERICVEEVSGVCLKYKNVSGSGGGEAASRPQAVSAAERRERDLNLTRSDRRAAQRGLAAARVYSGAIDGLFGAGTRRAIRNWQGQGGRAATGFLTSEDFRALSASSGEAVAAAAPANDPGDIADIVNNLFCISMIDGMDAKVTFRSDGTARALNEDATMRVTWEYDGRDFCVFSSGRKVRCTALNVPPTEANRDQIRNTIRRGC